MPSERDEMIGFLLGRLDERDKLIVQLNQQAVAAKLAAAKTTTEHPSTMANKVARRRK